MPDADPHPNPAPGGAEHHAPALAPGWLVGGGRFSLKKQLGQGGMGVVWLAHDERLDDRVALKFLPHSLRNNQDSLQALRKETQRSRRLGHANIVRIYDLYEAPGEDPFICMEYIDGPNLSELQARKPAGFFPWAELKPLVKQLCDALDFAHSETFIHRDLKPVNLMVDSKGRLKLADFGLIAFAVEAGTHGGTGLFPGGTVNYMCPQQLDGLPPCVTDDIYALGATLYDFLTTQPPFYVGDIEHQVRSSSVLPIEERMTDLCINNPVPRDVAALIMACLSKDPAARPQSARAVAEWIGLTAPAQPIEILAATLFQAAPAAEMPARTSKHGSSPPIPVARKSKSAVLPAPPPPPAPQLARAAEPGVPATRGIGWLIAAVLVTVAAIWLGVWLFRNQHSQSPPPAAPGPVSSLPADAGLPAETREQHEARMRWWREARFGMFVHWGLYSVPGGDWKGSPARGASEWLMYYKKIPVADYAAQAGQFNPVDFNADDWAKLAQDAGMRYLIVTAKHHEGFAMFRSQASPFNIYDATPFHRDPLKELADACQRRGLKLGFFYSQGQDWHHPGGAVAGGKRWDAAQAGDMDDYLDKIAVPQVRELLSNYGPVAALWWDINKDMTQERAEKFLPLLKLQPAMLINSRLGGGFPGDFAALESADATPDTPGQDWELAMTINNSWGYKTSDHDFKSSKELLRGLIDTASRGGNCLMNVGPDGSGMIPAPESDRLREIGGWLKANGEAIYGTSAGPFAQLPFEGRCTQKPGRLYLHVFDWPPNHELLVPVSNQIKNAYLLSDPAGRLVVDSNLRGKVINLPATAPDPTATVVVAELDGPARVVE